MDDDGALRAQGTPWARDGAVVWTLAAGVLLLAAGALSGRADVMLLGLAPVATALWSVRTRPLGSVWVDVVPPSSAPGVAGPDRLVTEVHLASPPGTEAVRVRFARVGHTSVEALVDVPLTRSLTVRAGSVRTGYQDLVHVDAQGVAGSGALTAPVVRSAGEQVLVLPNAHALAALPLPLRLRGLTGQHGSRRPGDGGGLRDVHPFQPGDDPRRVDWKVTARRSPRLEELYVRRTLALAEASVTLVMDSRDDVGPDPGTWSGMRPVHPGDQTSLDVARAAAATVAQAYLTAGDRVGVEDLGVRRRALRAGAGRRHLDRVLHQLALIRPEGEPARRVRPPHIPSGSLVYLFSTFLDQEAATLAQVWRRQGHRVVAVDTLPQARMGALDTRHWLALRIVHVEREDRLAEVAASGAELIRWGDRDADATLQQMARQAHRRGSGAR